MMKIKSLKMQIFLGHQKSERFLLFSACIKMEDF